MTQTDERVILQRLSRGEISTDEAERQLAGLGEPDGDTVALEQPAVEPTAPTAGAAGAPAEAQLTQPVEQQPATLAGTSGSDEELRMIRVHLNGSDLVEIVGDEDLDDPYVEGPASVHTDIDGERFVLHGQVGDDALVHVPAAADMDLHVNSADVTLRGVRGRLDAHLNVGDASLGLIQLHEGESHIHANCGDMTIVFGPGSDVTVAQLAAASLSAEGGFVKTGRGRWTLGSGTAQLSIDGNLGSITLVGPEDDR